MSMSKKIIIGSIVVILIIGAGFIMLQKPSVSGESGDVGGNQSFLEHLIRPIIHGGVPGDGGGG